MLRKKDSFTVITPIPGFIPRQLAIDILHAHSEVITLNPLVLDHKPIPAPQDAETDEYYATWYEITERIQVVPGFGRMGASTIKFNGCFHDMPWGLQTHIYAPMNVDLRNTYRIAGNQPGVEPPEIPEMGLRALGAPADGLYLREDIEIRCNVAVLGFVKSQLKKAGGEMVRRIIKKAELLDAGVLQAMIENGKLKTINPADRSNPLRSPLPSPTSLHYSSSTRSSPRMGSPPVGSPPMPYQIPRVTSAYPGYHRPGTAASQANGGYQPYPPVYGHGAPDGPQELPGCESYPETQMPVEMPGDFYHAPPELQPARQAPPEQAPHQDQDNNRESSVEPRNRPQSSPNPPLTGKWSPPGSRPASMPSSLGPPGPENKGAASSLAPHQETTDEYQDQQGADKPRIPHPPHRPPYNPADYARIPTGQQAVHHARGQQPQR